MHIAQQLAYCVAFKQKFQIPVRYTVEQYRTVCHIHFVAALTWDLTNTFDSMKFILVRFWHKNYIRFWDISPKMWHWCAAFFTTWVIAYYLGIYELEFNQIQYVWWLLWKSSWLNFDFDYSTGELLGCPFCDYHYSRISFSIGLLNIFVNV